MEYHFGDVDQGRKDESEYDQPESHIGNHLMVFVFGETNRSRNFHVFFEKQIAADKKALSTILCKCKRDSVISSLISGFCFQK